MSAEQTTITATTEEDISRIAERKHKTWKDISILGMGLIALGYALYDSYNLSSTLQSKKGAIITACEQQIAELNLHSPHYNAVLFSDCVLSQVDALTNSHASRSLTDLALGGGGSALLIATTRRRVRTLPT